MMNTRRDSIAPGRVRPGSASSPPITCLQEREREREKERETERDIAKHVVHRDPSWASSSPMTCSHEIECECKATDAKGQQISNSSRSISPGPLFWQNNLAGISDPIYNEIHNTSALRRNWNIQVRSTFHFKLDRRSPQK